eukprot:TRINITY_DN34997_c0_g1_i1.p1 TRINITY_DN34997_c0_g1~~TRINITY_DN34997_c0_g1_i1.p1  ORF type:complete len:304 (+),score=54.68 TRINITY_DN34997_c0_g1_i1:44-913(+)
MGRACDVDVAHNTSIDAKMRPAQTNVHSNSVMVNPAGRVYNVRVADYVNELRERLREMIVKAWGGARAGEADGYRFVVTQYCMVVDHREPMYLHLVHQLLNGVTVSLNGTGSNPVDMSVYWKPHDGWLSLVGSAFYEKAMARDVGIGLVGAGGVFGDGCEFWEASGIVLEERVVGDVQLYRMDCVKSAENIKNHLEEWDTGLTIHIATKDWFLTKLPEDWTLKEADGFFSGLAGSQSPVISSFSRSADRTRITFIDVLTATLCAIKIQADESPVVARCNLSRTEADDQA